MMARPTIASWETMLRRGLMTAQGTCTPAEYQRMTAEKVAAVQMSMAALMTGRGQAAVLEREAAAADEIDNCKLRDSTIYTGLSWR